MVTLKVENILEVLWVLVPPITASSNRSEEKTRCLKVKVNTPIHSDNVIHSVSNYKIV